VSIFVGLVCRKCLVCVRQEQCRRGDLNPRPYLNALNTLVTLTPHRLYISMRYPSTLKISSHRNHTRYTPQSHENCAPSVPETAASLISIIEACDWLAPEVRNQLVIILQQSGEGT
jgi:hypothetical protein